MKKHVAILVAFLMLVSLCACAGGTGSSAGTPAAQTPNVPASAAPASDTSEPAGSDPAASGSDAADPVSSAEDPVGSTAEVQEPAVNWWSIKTNTGIPTFVAEFENPNRVPVDLLFTVSYYLGGDLIQTREDLYVNALGAGEQTMVFDTWEIPERADDIQVTYTYLEESVYTPVTADIVSEEFVDGNLNLRCSADGDFGELEVYAAFFSGDTLTAIGLTAFFPGDELETSIEVLDPFDSYKLYVHAYRYS